MAGEITQQQIDALLKMKQPVIYYHETSHGGRLKGYEEVVTERFLGLGVGLLFAGFFTSLMTLDDIDGWKTVNEGTDFEYETATNEGLLYALALTIFTPLILAPSFAAIYYYLTKPDITLSETDRGTNKETEAKNEWAQKQLEAETNKPQSLGSFLNWSGVKKRPDSRSMESLVASNSHSIN